jgi:hypothetical protein
MRAAADSAEEPDWDSMKRDLALSPILNLLPSDMEDRMHKAEKKDKETRKRMENLPKVCLLEIRWGSHSPRGQLSKIFDLINIKLFFAGEGPELIGEDYSTSLLNVSTSD